MLYESYCWIGRVAYKLALPIMKRLPFSPRVRVVLLNEKRQILVVKNWFGPQTWSLPGGGVGRYETFQQAAVREVHEETGIVVDETQLSFVGKYSKAAIRAPFAAHCLLAFVKNQKPYISKLRHIEIISMKWVGLAHAPTMDPLVQKIIQNVNVEP